MPHECSRIGRPAAVRLERALHAGLDQTKGGEAGQGGVERVVRQPSGCTQVGNAGGATLEPRQDMEARAVRDASGFRAAAFEGEHTLGVVAVEFEYAQPILEGTLTRLNEVEWAAARGTALEVTSSKLGVSRHLTLRFPVGKG